MNKIIGINFHEEKNINGVNFKAFHAGHVIGAAMFLIEYKGVKVLYTGDYSREKDIHIVPAEIPKTKIDILIVESTYGIKCHEPREFREKLFLETIEKIVKRNGKCLLPVFVLGRA
jgi:cleavage and polyadenylation specificity factor subunit 3